MENDTNHPMNPQFALVPSGRIKDFEQEKSFGRGAVRSTVAALHTHTVSVCCCVHVCEYKEGLSVELESGCGKPSLALSLGVKGKRFAINSWLTN